MSGLLDAITTEIADREQRRDTLGNELDTIVEQIEQLRAMQLTAQTLNDAGTVEEPAPGKPSSPSAKPRRSGHPSPGRNGGNAPGGRRPLKGRKPGSAPSGKPAPARSGSRTSNGDGGTKRAAVLAFVAANGQVKAAQVAKAVNISPGAVRQHLKTLVDDGQIQAQGATSSRIYFTTTNGDQAAADRAQPHTPGGTAAATAVPLPELKRQVTNAISQDQGMLTEDRLALALNLDREDIAMATGELLDSATIELQPDGTYITGRGGGREPVNTSETTSRILAALTRATSAWTASEVAYQASKDGGPQIKPAAAEVALLDLHAAGKAAKFPAGASGGKTTWRTAE